MGISTLNHLGIHLISGLKCPYLNSLRYTGIGTLNLLGGSPHLVCGWLMGLEPIYN